MSIFSDYECGAMSDAEFHNACVRMNAEERYDMEHGFTRKCPYAEGKCKFAGLDCDECDVYWENSEDENEDEN